MNQKTVKLIRKFVRKSFGTKTKAEQKRMERHVRNTYQKQTDVQRNIIKREMRLVLNPETQAA